MTQIDEFFEGLPKEDKVTDKEADIFNKPDTPQGENKVENDPEKDEEPHKNRRHRRLEQQLAEEREARIRAEARLESESSRFIQETDNTDVDARWLRIYGDTPETREAWRLQKDILNDYKEEARQEALNDVHDQQIESAKLQQEAESTIDSELEAIEDEFNIDVTSNSPAAIKARREFLGMIQDASPKDENGEITAYADFGTVWEYYQLKNSKDKGSTDRKREISSKTMNKQNGSTTTEQTITPGFNGWRKDYGMN